MRVRLGFSLVALVLVATVTGQDVVWRDPSPHGIQFVKVDDRVQLTTDGHKAYLEAVESAFNEDIDYAMLSKIYRSSGDPDTRYSPAQCIGCETKIISGTPDPKHVSTS